MYFDIVLFQMLIKVTAAISFNNGICTVHCSEEELSSVTLDTVLCLTPLDLYVKQRTALSAIRLRESGYWKQRSSILNPGVLQG